MGTLARAIDWQTSPLGTPDTWPLSLRTMVGVVMHSAFPMALFWGDELTSFYNDAFSTSLGIEGKPPSSLGAPAQQVWGETWDFIGPLLEQVMATGEPGWHEDQLVPLYRNGRMNEVYWTFSYSPAYGNVGQIAGVLVTCTETTQKVIDRQKLIESELLSQSIIEHSPMATVVFVGPEMIIERINQNMLAMLGRDETILGKPFMETMPELVSTPLMSRLRHVLATGETYYQPEEKIELIRFGQPYTGYYNYTYKALRNAANERYGVVVTATEVTNQVRVQQEVMRFKYMADNARDPFILMRQDGSFAYLNDLALERWGYTPEEAEHIRVPDVDPIYTDEVFKAAFAQAQIVPIPPFETLHRRKDDTIYPVEISMGGLHLDGQPHMFAIARDITERKQAQQALAQSEATLRGAIELAKLGTWSYDLATGITEFSGRLREWFGFTSNEVITPQRGFQPIRPADRPLVEHATQHAVTPGSDGIYEVEFTLQATPTSQERIIHSMGKVQLDQNGQPYRLVGTAQDVTVQRNLQLALEQQVQERTEELAATNEELATTIEELASNNEEYAAINEELTATSQELIETNVLLLRSNENLQRFAYVASHDLQEPLRKIQQFGDLLKTRFADRSGEELVFLERMQSAASRMSVLIRDLLNFSRIATQPERGESVSLTKLMQAILTDLELVIDETGAHVELAPLPTVDGDASQLSLLFTNLLSNALKFRRSGLAPVVEVKASWKAADHLPAGVKPSRLAIAYHLIEVVDNGIGFDEKYLDRMFEVFQRLHGRGEYAGTGIGLAICQKVVTNHGGAITAHSQPGQGATFQVYLPV